MEYSRVLLLVFVLSVVIMETNCTRFYYSRKGKSTREISTSTNATTLQSFFKSKRQVKFIFHGHYETIQSESAQTLYSAYLPTGVNIVMVDWSDVAGNPIYLISLLGVSSTGGDVADMIKALVAANVTEVSKIHMIGFSLGAHIAGKAGSLLSPKVARITGLDATGIGYDPTRLDNWLDKSDAQFVDSIHTCGGSLGYSERYAHMDFYPNNGIPIQPNCTTVLSPIPCSHYEAFRMFSNSVSNTTLYPASQSASWLSFVISGCTVSSPVYMGEGVSTSSPEGTYYLLTNSRPCFL